MRTFETKIQELKTAVLTEVARLTWGQRQATRMYILIGRMDQLVSS